MTVTLPFFSSCVSWPIEVSELQTLIESAEDISRKTFLKHVDPEVMRGLEEDLGYAKHPSQGLTMAKDWHVSYHKGKLLGCAAFYFVHSAIEYVFADPACVESAVREGGRMEGAERGGCHPLLKSFGMDLRKFLYKVKEGFVILPADYATWVSGGCWILAEALHAWIREGSSLFSVLSEDGIVQHVVVKIGECYLDGDGASTGKELIRRWETIEGVRGPRLEPFDPTRAGEIQCPIHAVSELVKALEGKFGPGYRVLEWASETS